MARGYHSMSLLGSLIALLPLLVTTQKKLGMTDSLRQLNSPSGATTASGLGLVVVLDETGNNRVGICWDATFSSPIATLNITTIVYGVCGPLGLSSQLQRSQPLDISQLTQSPSLNFRKILSCPTTPFYDLTACSLETANRTSCPSNLALQVACDGHNFDTSLLAKVLAPITGTLLAIIFSLNMFCAYALPPEFNLEKKAKKQAFAAVSTGDESTAKSEAAGDKQQNTRSVELSDVKLSEGR